MNNVENIQTTNKWDGINVTVTEQEHVATVLLA